MAAQVWTWDFWLSSTAGLAVLGVAFLPTKRPNLDANAILCGPTSIPTPPGCAPLQQAFGEIPVATIHYIFAGTFILSLAAICFLFGRRERIHMTNAGRARFHEICGALILAAVAWVAVGRVLNLNIVSFTPLYVGEVVSVYAFSVSWLVKAWDLLKALLLVGS
jgi:hypothetical protein